MVRAIETRYGGHHFRSRIEARWAIFFDVLGLNWDYETDKFDTGTERYIPDFKIFFPAEDRDEYLEIKGAPPADNELRKAKAIGAFLAHGKVNEFIVSTSEICGEIGDSETGPHSAMLTQCLACGAVGFSCAIHGRFFHDCEAETARSIFEQLSWNLDIDSCFLDFTSGRCAGTSLRSPLIMLATEAARSARFESPEFKTILDTYKAAAQVLKETRVYGTKDDYHSLFEFAFRLAVDPGCPRNEQRRRSVA